MCVCVCVRACVHACVRVCVAICIHILYSTKRLGGKTLVIFIESLMFFQCCFDANTKVFCEYSLGGLTAPSQVLYYKATASMNVAYMYIVS